MIGFLIHDLCLARAKPGVYRRTPPKKRESEGIWTYVTRYNPFKSFRYDKYSHPNNNSFNEIKQIENILDNCSSYNMQELNDLIKANKSTFSIMFNNIDGVTSNFDLFSTKLLSTNNQISILTFAETNLDECNKNLFNI